MSHAVHGVRSRVRVNGSETPSGIPWFGFARYLDGSHVDLSQVTQVVAQSAAHVAAQLASLLDEGREAHDGDVIVDITADDAHLLPSAELDVLAELSIRYRCVIGVHPGEGRATEVFARFPNAVIVQPTLVGHDGLRQLLAALDVPTDRHTKVLQQSSGLPGVARAIAIGGPMHQAMFVRYDALASQLDPASRAWVVRAELAPTDEDRLLLPPPPDQLVSLFLADEHARRCHITPLVDRVLMSSQNTLRNVREELAAILTDPISRAQLLRDNGEDADAAAVALAHVEGEPDPDRRATLLACATTTPTRSLSAASALLQRERPDEASTVLQQLTGDSDVVHAVDRTRLEAQLARQLELPDRWQLVSRMFDGPLSNELTRQSNWFAGVPLPLPSIDAPLPRPEAVDDLDVARLAWNHALIGVIDSDIAERSDRYFHWQNAATELRREASVNQSWLTMLGQAEALHRLATTGPSSDIVDLLIATATPSLPRALLDACRVLALADAGDSSNSLAVTPTVAPTAPVERSLWAWARAEAEYAAGHPLAAIRAAQGAEEFHGIAAVLARACAAWAALDVSEVRAAPPSATAASGWLLSGTISETRTVAAFAALLSADSIDSASALEVSADFQRLADRWQGWYVRAELRCRWAAGEASRLAGSADAIDQLSMAEELAERAGLAPLLQRIRRSLRLAGVRRTGRRTTSTGPLSAREFEVIGLVGKGLSTRTIATRLGISPATVETQVASVMAKFGVRSRLQAALQAQKLQS